MARGRKAIEGWGWTKPSPDESKYTHVSALSKELMTELNRNHLAIRSEIIEIDPHAPEAVAAED